jgi:hypothetical protein
MATSNVEPVTRYRTHEVLVGIAQLLTEELAELRHIRALLERRDQQPYDRASSVKIGPKPSDVVTHVYASSPVLTAEQEALNSYRRITAELEQRQMDAFGKTVDALRSGK